MKKIYSFIAIMILAAIGFVANAATAKVYIDNKSGVYLYINGDNWYNVEDQLVNGEYVDIQFTAGLTWNLDSSRNLTFFQVVRNGEVIASNITPVFDIGFDFSVSDGDIIEIFVNAPSTGKATAKVYCDDIQYSLFIYDKSNDDWIDITSQLTVGKTANIEFDPETQSMWNIEGVCKFYLIELDGTTLLSDSTLPGVDMDINGMKNGSELNIYVNNPNATNMATITVDYGTAGEEAIRYMTVNGDDVYVVDGKFKAPIGSQLLIFPDTNIYTFTSVKLGNTELNYIVASGCYAATINGDATLYIDAEPKPDTEITFNINDASTISVFKARNTWFIGTEEVEGLVDGTNTLSFSPTYPVIDIKVNDGFAVESATYTTTSGNTYDLSFDTWGMYYYVDVINNNVASIDIVAKEKVYEYITFGVELYCVDQLKSYFIRTNNVPRVFLADSDEPDLKLENGINEFTITTEQAASIRINLEFEGEAVTDVTIDGQPVTSIKYEEYDNSVWGDFSIEDGQVLKIGSNLGINGITSGAANGKVYDMRGIEVKNENLPAGIYVINGKKTIVK